MRRTHPAVACPAVAAVGIPCLVAAPRMQEAGRPGVCTQQGLVSARLGLVFLPFAWQLWRRAERLRWAKAVCAPAATQPAPPQTVAPFCTPQHLPSSIIIIHHTTLRIGREGCRLSRAPSRNLSRPSTFVITCHCAVTSATRTPHCSGQEPLQLAQGPPANVAAQALMCAVSVVWFVAGVDPSWFRVCVWVSACSHTSSSLLLRCFCRCCSI